MMNATNFTGLVAGSYLFSLDLGSYNGTNTCDWDFGATVTLIPTALFLSLMFIITRRMKGLAFGYDDIMQLFSMLSLISFMAFNIKSKYEGIGKHIWVVLAAEDDPTRISLNLMFPLDGAYYSYTVAMMSIRLFILAFYKRIFENTFATRLIQILSGITISLAIASIFANVFMCFPINSAWSWNVPQDKCIHIQAYFYSSGAINVALDLAIWILPLRRLWKVNNTQSTRVKLIVLFGFGGFAVVCSILRVSRLKGLESKDITYTSVMPIAWSVIECSVSSICACIPHLMPLFEVVDNKFGDMISILQRGTTGLRSACTNLWNMIRTSWKTVRSLWGPSAGPKNEWPQPRDAKSGVEPIALQPINPNAIVARRGTPWARVRTVSSFGSARQYDPEVEVGFV